MKQVVLALGAALWLVVIGCGDNIAPDVDERCATPGDEDGNGLADCADPVCASSCQPVCGNDKVESGEDCDDGNSIDGDGCDGNCTPTGCGNGALSAGEDCDDGNLTDGDGCDRNCTRSGCGNGIPTAGEECDDGNANDYDGCTNACLVIECGDGVPESPEECDDGNAAELDGCTPACVLEPTEMEPNEDGTPQPGGAGITGNDFAIANADANGAVTRSTTILAALAPLGDEDVFKLTNTTTTMQEVRLDTWLPSAGIDMPCGTLINTVLQIRDDAGIARAFNDDRDVTTDRCSSATVGIAPGESLYVHVSDQGDDTTIAAYALEATFRPVTCNNGIVEPGESCEDGNAAPGDGCDALCRIEHLTEVEPNNTFAEADASALQLTGDATIRASISAVGDADTFRFSLAAPTAVRFETFTSYYECGAPVATDLRLFNAAGAPLATELLGAGIGTCGALVFHLDAGVHYIRVEERGNNAQIGSYFLQVDFQSNRAGESEPSNTTGVNDTIATASTNLVDGNGAVVYGDHLQVNDIDVYAITVPPRGRIRAELVEGDRLSETCDSNGIDSLLTLYDQNGVQIAEDDNDGRGFCSLIDGTGSAPLDAGARNPTDTTQTYYLMVRRSPMAGGGERIFVYRAQVSFR